jgi:hypothetical protein
MLWEEDRAMELLDLLEAMELGLDMVQLLLEEPGMGIPEELAKELWGR